jgi:hypothetical protein
MNAQDFSGKQRLGWHWLWFVPLCVVVLLVVEWHTVTYAFTILKLGYQRWSWGALFSPSAYFCLGIIETSVDWPIRGLWLITVLIKSANELKARQRLLYSVLLIVGIFLLPFIVEALIWGSFPFVIDDQGISRLRLFPFIPWPWGRFGEY